jgi:hypothetical protein
VQTTRFRLWLYDSKARPDWTHVKLVDPPQYTGGHVVEVTVAGDGSDLRRLFAERPNIFAACLEVSQEED